MRFKAFVFACIFLCSSQLYAHAQGFIKGVRYWPALEGNRLVFDINGPLDYKAFLLKRPDRVVIDFKNTTLWADLTHRTWQKDGLVRTVRVGNTKDVLRVVLETRQAVKMNSFVLRPNAEYGYRLVLDLSPVKPMATPKLVPVSLAKKPFIIAVDAGHGGEDSGARGRYGTLEKNVVLGIAKQLAARINQTVGMKAVLTREGDYYIGLRQRTILARKQHADLFVSLHADSFYHANAKGASVFVLSQHGASSEAAKILARKENASDEIGGINLENKDKLLARVLIDLSQSLSIKKSNLLAEVILSQLKTVSLLHKNNVQRAGFMVLKSAAIPSVLVETGFISHPSTERKLRTKAYQTTLADTIFKGITQYMKRQKLNG